MPLRDDRRGRRATLARGSAPLRPDFDALAPAGNDTAPSPDKHDQFGVESSDTSPVLPFSPAQRNADNTTDARAPNEPSHPPQEAHVDFAQKGLGAASPSQVPTAAMHLEARDHSTADPSPSEGDEMAHESVALEPLDEIGVATPATPTIGALHVRPLALVAAAWQRLCDALGRPAAISLPADTRDHDDVVVERSFADELASLIAMGPTSESDIAQDASASEHIGSASVAHEESAERAIFSDADRAEYESQAANAHPVQSMVVPPVRASVDRVVPLTRLPLRPQSGQITWFYPLDLEGPPQTASGRHALLMELAADRARAGIALLTQAYHEEDARGRLLALRALAALHNRDAIGTFVDALHAGTDDERVAAIDALAAAGARDALTVALGDRVEAVAAHAALAFVQTNVREDYVRGLEPYVDAGRIEAILALLAGFVE